MNEGFPIVFSLVSLLSLTIISLSSLNFEMSKLNCSQKKKPMKDLHSMGLPQI